MLKAWLKNANFPIYSYKYEFLLIVVNFIWRQIPLVLCLNILLYKNIILLHTIYFFQGHTVARSTPVEVCFSPDAQYVISGMANSFTKALDLDVFPIEIKRKESQSN